VTLWKDHAAYQELRKKKAYKVTKDIGAAESREIGMARVVRCGDALTQRGRTSRTLDQSATARGGRNKVAERNCGSGGFSASV